MKLKVNNCELNKVESANYLGIYIDSHLTWESHIEYIYKK